MTKKSIYLILVILLMIVPVDKFTEKAHSHTYVENITYTDNDSLNPYPIKIDNGYKLFWEEKTSDNTIDILFVELDENGKAISKISNLTNNKKDYSYISSIVKVEEVYYILSLKIVTQKKLGDSANYYYEMYIYNPNLNFNKIRKEFIYNAIRVSHFERPSLIYDGKYLVMLYTKNMNSIYFTSNLYIQKYTLDWVEFGDEFFINFDEAQDRIQDLVLIDEDEEYKIIEDEFTIRTHEKDTREITGKDELKVQPKIFYRDGKYHIFFRAKTHETHEEGLYIIQMMDYLSYYTKPALISTDEYNANNYRVHYDEENDAFFILWEDYKTYNHKYISSEKAIYRRIEKKHKSNYISNIVKSGNSYFYARIVEEFNKQRMLMERANILELDYDRDIRISIFEEDPKTPFMVSYRNGAKNTGMYGEPLKDYDKMSNTITVFWSEKIDDVYQIMFHKLNF